MKRGIVSFLIIVSVTCLATGVMAQEPETLETQVQAKVAAALEAKGEQVGTTVDAALEKKTPSEAPNEKPKEEPALEPAEEVIEEEVAPPTTPEEEIAPPAETAPAPMAPENSLAKCTDGADNDGDQFVDCADQDCTIFAVCVQDEDEVTPATAASPEEVEGPTELPVERGRLCKDGIDNDEDGAMDCHDTKCQPSNYCQKLMYERPVDPKKKMGPFLQMNLGMAFPNFHWDEVRVDSVFGQNIPFDPDMGWMGSLKFGIAPIRWLGFGLNLNGGTTFATNREEFIAIPDREENYKYDGVKYFGHLGGFVRLQFPFRRMTTYVDLAGGYSFTRYRWRVYSGQTDWDDVGSYWESLYDDEANLPAHQNKYRHGDTFSVALEPGFNIQVIHRFLGVGASAWIPIWESGNEGMENVGIMLNVLFTPAWREAKQLKPEYQPQ